MIFEEGSHILEKIRNGMGDTTDLLCRRPGVLVWTLMCKLADGSFLCADSCLNDDGSVLTPSKNWWNIAAVGWSFRRTGQNLDRSRSW